MGKLWETCDGYAVPQRKPLKHLLHPTLGVKTTRDIMEVEKTWSILCGWGREVPLQTALLLSNNYINVLL